MSLDRILLCSPHMGGKELLYIQEAFDTNWIAPAGSNVDIFEEDLQNYLGEEHVTVLNSGTAAIHLGLIVLGVQAEDIVLCQSMTFSASAYPILYLGAIPVFIDSEAETHNLCPVALEKAILDCVKLNKKPKAIIAVHLYGVPYKVDEIRTIADKYEIAILEDSAEALGSKYNGQMCGTFGDVGVLSFNGSKIITTSGGGALITRTAQLKQKAIFLATQSKDKAVHYQHSEIGYNYRMSNISAGIGRGQMEVLNDHIVFKETIHQFYVDLFKNIEGVEVYVVPNGNSFANYWLTTILVNPKVTNGINKEMLRLAFQSKNIESRPLWKPLHLQPVFSQCRYYGTTISENLFEHGLCLPSGPMMSAAHKNRIQVVVQELFGT